MNNIIWECPICQSKQFSKIAKYPASSILFSNRKLMICSNCGCKSIYPMINEKELDEYNKNYWSIAQSNSELSRNRYILLAKSRAEYLSEKLDILNNFEILDVGAGHGYIIDALKNKFPNIKTYAVEIDTQMHDTLSKKADHVISSWRDITNTKFNLIVISHVLEHIVNPIEFLFDLKDLLKKNGFIFIEVPNNDDFHKKSLESHLTVFNKSAIKWLVREIGMEIVDLNIIGQKLTNLRPPLQYRVFEKLFSKKLFQKYRVFHNRFVSFRRRKKTMSEILELHKKGNNRRWIRIIIRKSENL